MPIPKWAQRLYDGNMNSKVTLDLTVNGDEVTLPPTRGATPLQKERGVWVFRTGKPLSAGETEDTLCAIRAQRHRRNSAEHQ